MQPELGTLQELQLLLDHALELEIGVRRWSRRASSEPSALDLVHDGLEWCRHVVAPVMGRQPPLVSVWVHTVGDGGAPAGELLKLVIQLEDLAFGRTLEERLREHVASAAKVSELHLAILVWADLVDYLQHNGYLRNF